MKAFLTKVFVFSLPVIACAIALELFIRFSPNAFNAKAHYIEHHANDIKLLILGSSHNQNAVNPEFLPFAASNLAYGGQDIKLDSALFFHYQPSLTHLKAVVLELDYHSLEELNGEDYFRLAWYRLFHQIHHGEVPLLSQISLYASEPEFFNDHLKRTFDPREYKYEMNEFGFLRNDFPGVFLSNNNDSASIAQGAPQRLATRHTRVSVENFNQNTLCLESIIDSCKAKNITVFLVASPMYSTYRGQEKEEKLSRRREFLNKVVDNRAVYYLDFEASPHFGVVDFKNDDHLNSSGAEKYTKMLGDSLLKLQPSLLN